MKKYVCTVCAWIYDPAVGDPDSGIAPGTAFEDIPEDWTCPICGVGKEDFNPIGQRALDKLLQQRGLTAASPLFVAKNKGMPNLVKHTLPQINPLMPPT